VGTERPSTSQFATEVSRDTILSIIVVEDNPADVYVIRLVIEGSGLKAAIQVFRDGEAAINFFEAVARDQGTCPDLMLLDLNLPKLPGKEVLEFVRHHPPCQRVPVIVVSSADSLTERLDLLSSGAQGYFHKPSKLDEFMKLGELIRRLLPA
jgi:CheY-like chemotaxis protein